MLKKHHGGEQNQKVLIRSQPTSMTKEKGKRWKECAKDREVNVWRGELGNIHDGITSRVTRIASKAAVPELLLLQSADIL